MLVLRTSNFQGASIRPIVCTLVKYNKTLFTQGSPFSSKAGVHRGPVS